MKKEVSSLNNNNVINSRTDRVMGGGTSMGGNSLVAPIKLNLSK